MDIMEGVNSIYSVIVAIVTVLGSAAAWNYYDNRAKDRRSIDDFIKTDCNKRIDKLEILLEKSSKEKDEMRKTILDLTSQVSELRVKVDYLATENDRLKRLI
jgi:peptidoglycan hydrolase CwlO-like protein